jgi:hypothetical protein
LVGEVLSRAEASHKQIKSRSPRQYRRYLGYKGRRRREENGCPTGDWDEAAEIRHQETAQVLSEKRAVASIWRGKKSKNNNGPPNPETRFFVEEAAEAQEAQEFQESSRELWILWERGLSS